MVITRGIITSINYRVNVVTLSLEAPLRDNYHIVPIFHFQMLNGTR